KSSRKSHKKIYDAARLIVGNGVITCIECGCTDNTLIIINHEKGGGQKEYQSWTSVGTSLYYAIRDGRRPTHGFKEWGNLQLLCKSCHNKHLGCSLIRSHNYSSHLSL